MRQRPRTTPSWWRWRRSAPTGSAPRATRPAKIAELAKASSWERGSVVEKSGYALMPGSKTTNSDVARACAEMLATPPTPKT